MKRVKPKVPRVPQESFFATCKRDRQGHCIAGPGGSGDSSPVQVTERGVPGQSRPVKGDKTKDKVEGTKHTVDKLEKAARRAGESLFKKHQSGLVLDPISRVDHYNLSELQKPDAESGQDAHMLDEYEYVFFPSTGKGKDVAGGGWDEADDSWKDRDGHIYTVTGTGILTVVKADTSAPKKQAVPKEPREAGIQEDPKVKVGKFHLGQHVEYNRPGRMTSGKPGAQIEGITKQDGEVVYKIQWPDGAGTVTPAKYVRAVQ
jgi:hypothetical protein